MSAPADLIRYAPCDTCGEDHEVTLSYVSPYKGDNGEDVNVYEQVCTQTWLSEFLRDDQWTIIGAPEPRR